MHNNKIPSQWLGLDSAVCVVTGAAGGIGAALAGALVAQQAHVVLLDRDLDKCRELAATLGEHSVGEVSALGCDIATRPAWSRPQPRFRRCTGAAMYWSTMPACCAPARWTC